MQAKKDRLLRPRSNRVTLQGVTIRDPEATAARKRTRLTGGCEPAAFPLMPLSPRDCRHREMAISTFILSQDPQNRRQCPS